MFLSKHLRAIVICLFILSAITTGLLLLVASSETSTPTKLNSLTKFLPTWIFPKVTIVNKSDLYRISSPKNSNLESLINSFNLYNNPVAPIERVQIITGEEIQSGNTYSLDNKVWATTSTLIKDGNMYIFVDVNIQAIKLLPKTVDWNANISRVVLSEFMNYSPLLSNSTPDTRFDFVTKLIRDMKNSGREKYYFEISL